MRQLGKLCTQGREKNLILQNITAMKTFEDVLDLCNRIILCEYTCKL